MRVARTVMHRTRSELAPARRRSIVEALWAFWRDGRRVERVGYATGTLLIASGLIHLAILIASGASWQGPLSWRKPMAFGLSFGLALISIVWVSSFLRLRDRMRTTLLAVFTIASVVETFFVSLQTWRGVPSHFNVETSADALVARMLAAFGFLLIVVIVTLTLASFRRQPGVPLSLRVAIRIGFVALVAAQVTGGLMIAKGMGLVFAGQAQAAYATGGTLKPTHAVTMHGIQLLPVLAWLLSFTEWSERRRLAVVIAAAAAYVFLAAAIIVANVAGK